MWVSENDTPGDQGLPTGELTLRKFYESRPQGRHRRIGWFVAHTSNGCGDGR